MDKSTTIAPGAIFQNLTVLQLAYTNKRKTFYKCKCICGNIKMIRGDSLKTAKSCGCFGKWSAQEIATLITNYENIEITKLCLLLPTKTIDAIYQKAAKLGLSKATYTKKIVGTPSEKHKLFIAHSRMIHANKYTYDKVIYINNTTHVTVTCKFHGDWNVTPGNHLAGYDCPKCGVIAYANFHRSSKDEFIQEAHKVHKNAYTYDLVCYTNSRTKVTISCKEHGQFFQRPSDHLRGDGCPRCKNLLSTEDFIIKAKQVHGDRYDYTSSRYKTSKELITIGCPRHGSFLQRAGAHLVGNGCSSCYRSKGEQRIFMYLTSSAIDFVPQHTFDTCVNPITNYKLRFDFFLSKNNILIEYDGKQHFEPWSPVTEKSIKRFQLTKYRDNLKTIFAKENGIRLIRIPYTQFRNITTILGTLLQTEQRV